MEWFRAKGAEAARLRKRKYELVRKYGIQENLLPGSLSLTHRRCGKPTCHCSSGDGHPMWSLTFMVDGKKRVERIPDEWVTRLQPLARGGRAYKQAVSEVLCANAQLLTLWRKQSQATQQRSRKRRSRKSR